MLAYSVAYVYMVQVNTKTRTQHIIGFTTKIDTSHGFMLTIAARVIMAQCRFNQILSFKLLDSMGGRDISERNCEENQKKIAIFDFPTTNRRIETMNNE